MNKLFKQSFLDYLYKFIRYSNLLIKKEDLKESLLSRNIIIEDDNGICDINHCSEESYRFIDSNELRNVKNFELIQKYTNIIVRRYAGIISDQTIAMINHLFYYLFLDKFIINPNGELTPDSAIAKKNNILYRYISFKFS